MFYGRNYDNYDNKYLELTNIWGYGLQFLVLGASENLFSPLFFICEDFPIVLMNSVATAFPESNFKRHVYTFYSN